MPYSSQHQHQHQFSLQEKHGEKRWETHVFHPTLVASTALEAFAMHRQINVSCIRFRQFVTPEPHQFNGSSLDIRGHLLFVFCFLFFVFVFSFCRLRAHASRRTTAVGRLRPCADSARWRLLIRSASLPALTTAMKIKPKQLPKPARQSRTSTMPNWKLATADSKARTC